MPRSPRSPAAEAAAQDTARLEAEILALRAELSRLAETLGDTAQSRSAAFVETLNSETERLKARGAAAVEGLQDSAEGYVEDAKGYVRDNPLAALGFAALAGLIFGMVFGRR